MSVESTLNRSARLGAALTLIFAVVAGALGMVAPVVSVAVVLVSGGLLLWWIGKWGANASFACGVILVALAIVSAPAAGDLRPGWIRFPSLLGPIAVLSAGLALLSLKLRRRTWFNASVWLGTSVIIIAVLVLLNAAMGYGGNRSVFASVLGLVIGTSLTVTRMGPGFLRLIERKTPAGYIGRWMLVIVLVVPAALHVLQLKLRPPADQTGLVSLVLSSYAYAIALLGVLMFSLRRLDILELSRAEAQEERDRLMVRLQQEAATLQQQVSNRTMELASALKASMRFDYLARATTSGIMITDASGRIEWVNPAWERFSGYALAEVQGKRPREFLHGPETHTEEKEFISNAVRSGQSAKGEMINYRKNGEPFWIDLEMQPMRNEVGEIANFFAIVDDITERRRHAEEQRQLNERLGLALKALDCGVWDYDMLANRQTWDQRQCEIYGFTPSAIPGNIESFYKVVHPDDIQQVRDACADACEHGNAFEYSFRIIRPDGALRHISAHGIVRRDESGKPVRMVGLDRDVTSAMELREQLRVSGSGRIGRAVRSCHGILSLEPARMTVAAEARVRIPVRRRRASSRR
jgi:PAS domain S-box-containing protein